MNSPPDPDPDPVPALASSLRHTLRFVDPKVLAAFLEGSGAESVALRIPASRLMGLGFPSEVVDALALSCVDAHYFAADSKSWHVTLCSEDDSSFAGINLVPWQAVVDGLQGRLAMKRRFGREDGWPIEAMEGALRALGAEPDPPASRLPSLRERSVCDEDVADVPTTPCDG